MTSTNDPETPINALKARLDADQPGVGIIVSMPSVQTTQVLANAGFDWLFIDMEHGPIDIASAHAMITATTGTRAAPLVRVPWNVHWLVKPVLDAGAMGIIFPMIRSAEEAERAVRAVRYPPRGRRGFGPFYAPLRFGKTMEKGIRLNGLKPEVVNVDDVGEEHLLVHDERAAEPTLAYLLSRMGPPEFPTPVGVFRAIDKPVYDQLLMDQVRAAQERNPSDLQALFRQGQTWVVG